MGNPVVSIIIPAMRADKLKLCLGSILNACQAVDYEVVVVSPFDQEADLLHDPRFIYVNEGKPEGMTRAIAKGYARVTGEYVMLLVDDVLMGPDALTKMVAFMRLHDDEMFQGRFLHTFAKDVGPLLLGEEVAVAPQPIHNFWGYMFSGFPIMRKDRIDQLGEFFDTRYHSFWADADLGLRVWHHGGRIETCNDAIIVTYPNQDEQDQTTKSDWQDVDEKVFQARWTPTLGECFCIFGWHEPNYHGQNIVCPKCDKVYQWHAGDHRRCWSCREPVYDLMIGLNVYFRNGYVLHV
jgi:GT2 family glycosyltransferase